MNVACLAGYVATEPILRFINHTELTSTLCKFVLRENDDYFHVIAIDEKAKYLSNNFQKGKMVVLNGKFKNHFFEDANKTKHFTNVFLVNNIDDLTSGTDYESYIANKKGIMNNQKDELYYQKICDMGYLVIDENDYFEISNDLLRS